MGEAKVLVEMELDRDFPKIIALDDKQGNIFLVEVEYTWIPSTCGRCGNLGHKEKRCLLTSKPENVLQQQKEQHDRSDIHVVDIDVILEQRDSKTAKSSPTANPMKPKETCNTLSGIQSPSSHSQHEEPAKTLISVTIPSPLVDSQSTPTHSQIMETSPSNISNNAVLGSSDVGAFVTSPVHCAFESPSHFTILGDVDEDEIEPSTEFSLTRGGRESKAPIKYHNMEWKTVRGRGKRGRRGRSSSH
ncbi:unnamed protein product [Brassica oleracea var. botrytis]